MFNQLTKYLLQYKQVSIPFVGTIQLVQKPPQLNIADKTIQPPSFTAELKSGGNISDHQLNFLAAVLRKEKESVSYSLHELGSWLKEELSDEGFHWNGIGTVRYAGPPAVISVDGLETIAAEKVLRQDAEHNVLVGDQQMTSTQIAELKKEEKGIRRDSPLIIAGWILLLFAVLYILFILYQGKFRVDSTGSKQSATSLLFKKESSTTPNSRLQTPNPKLS